MLTEQLYQHIKLYDIYYISPINRENNNTFQVLTWISSSGLASNVINFFRPDKEMKTCPAEHQTFFKQPAVLYSNTSLKSWKCIKQPVSYVHFVSKRLTQINIILSEFYFCPNSGKPCSLYTL